MEGYLFIEFKISNSSIPTVFRQPLTSMISFGRASSVDGFLSRAARFVLRRGAYERQESQRHINGVVSNNNNYDIFGIGGIKRPFWYDPV